MTGSEDHACVVERAGGESTLRFLLTLIVATLMAAVTVYVLSYAALAPERMGSSHGAAAAQHLRS